MRVLQFACVVIAATVAVTFAYVLLEPPFGYDQPTLKILSRQSVAPLDQSVKSASIEPGPHDNGPPPAKIPLQSSLSPADQSVQTASIEPSPQDNDRPVAKIPVTRSLSPPDQPVQTASVEPRLQDDQIAKAALNEPRLWEDETTQSIPRKDEARLEPEFAPHDYSPASQPPKRDLSYLAYYAYSEVMPDRKPADTVLDSLKDVPVGTPIEEIKRASDAFGLDVTFMKTVAKIESDFDPKQRTGSYIGLFQLSHYEFDRFGSGEITDPRDNAIAAAYKFATAAILFEIDTHVKPTLNDLYLIHQQGWQGAAEHVAYPKRIAWKSMCATDEGRQKGEKWCKRAIWQNTLPGVKSTWKSVDNLPSGAFVEMWRQRIDQFYTRYSQATAPKEATAAK